MRKYWGLPAKGLVESDVLWCRNEPFLKGFVSLLQGNNNNHQAACEFLYLATNNMSNLHEVVIDDTSKVVSREPIRFQNNKVFFILFLLELAVDGIT